MDYGKRITTESYHEGRLSSTKVEVSAPMIVRDKNEALRELMNALDLITSGGTFQVTIKIDADPTTHHLKRITTQYVVQ